jgi:hypothetical protein
LNAQPGSSIAAPRAVAIAAYAAFAAFATWGAVRLWTRDPNPEPVPPLWLPPAIEHSLPRLLALVGVGVVFSRVLRLATTTYELSADACAYRWLSGSRQIRYEEIESVRWIHSTFTRVVVRGPRTYICILLWTLHPRARGHIARQLAARVRSDRQRGWEAICPHLWLPEDRCAICGFPRQVPTDNPCPECGALPEPEWPA